MTTAIAEGMVRNAVVSMLGCAPDSVAFDLTLDQLGMDNSLEHVEFVFALEDESLDGNLTIPDADSGPLRSQPLTAWVEYIARRIAPAEGAAHAAG